MNERHDVIIIGAGPAGLACGIEASRRELKFAILEKGAIVDSIFHYPTNMTFFTTSELLEIGEVPMIVSGEKPKRLDGLKYYRRVADLFQLPIRDYEEVRAIEGTEGDFQVQSRDRWGSDHVYRSRRVVIATGYYANPNLLGVPGENLAKVSHYYQDPHPYFRKRVAVVGGKNSAALAALDLYRNGAGEVTLIHRGRELGAAVKYWILPDINNRIKNEEIKAHFESCVTEIRPTEIVIAGPAGGKVIPNDFVLLMTGYCPDIGFLRRAGIEIDPDTLVPRHDPDTLETNVKGVFLAGAVLSGRNTNEIFIENGRFHGSRIFRDWPTH